LRGAGPQPGTQKPPAPLQTRPEVDEPHAGSPEAPSQPQMPSSVRHWGARPLHNEVFAAEHSVHAPASGPVRWQTGRAGSGQVGAPSAVQATHVRETGEHEGVTPPQSVSSRQATQRPPFAEVSQRGADAGQREVSVGVQAAQAPLGRQRGAAAPQSPSLAQARQDAVARSQTGLTPAQAPGLPAAHAAHAPAGVQTGEAAGQSPSLAQARHACVAPSQMGAAVPQSAFPRQAAQAPLSVAQSGVGPAHTA